MARDSAALEIEGGEGAGSQQGLLSKTRKRRWRTLAVIGIIGAVITILVIVLVVTFMGHERFPDELKSIQKLPTITLEEFVDYKLGASRFNGTWISGSEVMYKNDNNTLLVYDFKENGAHPLTLMNDQILTNSYEQNLSPDKKYLLVANNVQKVYRHSFRATYDIIDLQTGSIIPVWTPNVHLQLCMWSSVGNALVFVFDNNIYYKKSAADSKVIQITEDGVNETLYHGIPDWVYEEEVLSSNSALWFSPSGQNLAFASFDDSNTQVMTIPYYGQPGNLQFQYPIELHIRYPKPGTPNPRVFLHVINLTAVSNVNVSSEELISIPAPIENVTKDHILSAVTWASENELVAVWMNRVQNVAVIMACKISNKETNCSKLLEVSEPSGWVDLFTPPIFPKTRPGTSSMVLILPQEQKKDEGGSDHFRHVTRVDQRSDGLSPEITSLSYGKMVVTDILGWDDANGDIYFMGTVEGDPAQMHLYKTKDKIPSNESLPEMKCMSCGEMNEVAANYSSSWGPNFNCSHNSISFSKDYSLYAMYCAGPQIPEVSIFTKDGNRLTTWERNNALRALLSNRVVPDRMRLKVPIPDDLEAQVMLWLPPNMDTSGATKYPMIVYVYGGPDTNSVTERFTADWGTYMATNRSVIYAAIDGRGSGLNGNKLLFSGYRKLGTVEIEDQINVTRYLQQKFPFIDSKRTVVWGWSYGGYATGMALAKDDEGIFKCGISVAPVTDWAYYDTIYTERYMGLPTKGDNIQGYARSDLNSKAEKLRGKEYMLVHGTLDDNVHFQQSMMLSRVLETKDILFQQLSYPDEEHGLTGVRRHLYHSLERFLDQCFQLH